MSYYSYYNVLYYGACKIMHAVLHLFKHNKYLYYVKFIKVFNKNDFFLKPQYMYKQHMFYV